MKNKTVNFGYLEDIDITKYLKVNPNLRGCNDLNESVLTTYPELEEKIVADSYTYNRILSKNDDYFINLLYNHLVVMDIIFQIESSILNNGGVFCDFSDYEVPYLSKQNAIENLIMIMEYRGYNVSFEGNIVTILNTQIGTEFEDMMIFGTINVKYRLTNVDELLYRLGAESLDHTPQFAKINKEWGFRKSLVKSIAPEYNDVVSSSYYALKLYGYLIGIFDNCDPLEGDDLIHIQEAKIKEMNNLLNALIRCAKADEVSSNQLESLISVYRELESRVDEYFTSDMKIAVCPEIDSEMVNIILGYFFKTDTPKPEPVTLDFNVNFETKTFKFNKKLVALASAALILAVLAFIIGM